MKVLPFFHLTWRVSKYISGQEKGMNRRQESTKDRTVQIVLEFLTRVSESYFSLKPCPFSFYFKKPLQVTTESNKP